MITDYRGKEVTIIGASREIWRDAAGKVTSGSLTISGRFEDGTTSDLISLWELDATGGVQEINNAVNAVNPALLDPDYGDIVHEIPAPVAPIPGLTVERVARYVSPTDEDACYFLAHLYQDMFSESGVLCDVGYLVEELTHYTTEVFAESANVTELELLGVARACQAQGIASIIIARA